jgi:hypothetical protein
MIELSSSVNKVSLVYVSSPLGLVTPPSSDTSIDKIAGGIPNILYKNVNVHERLGGNFGLTNRTKIQTKTYCVITSCRGTCSSMWAILK